ncbi:MAG: molybdenum cofactor guanylyltransferase [bacterium]
MSDPPDPMNARPRKTLAGKPGNMTQGHPIAGTAGVVLAGGKSTRLGRDKAALDFGGVTLLERAVRSLAALFSEVIVVTAKGKAPGAPGAVAVEDLYDDRGPLGGIHAALKAAKAGRCFVVGCDTPFVPAPLIRFLCGFRAPDVVIPASAADRLHPLTAVYSTSCLPHVENLLGSGDNRIISFFPNVAVRVVNPREWRPYDPGALFTVNVNTMDDYRRSLRLLEQTRN